MQQWELLDYLNKNKHCLTVKDLSNHFNVNPHVIYIKLKKLYEYGFIKEQDVKLGINNKWRKIEDDNI